MLRTGYRGRLMKRKRGNAEGSIYHMQDGRWRAAVTTGKDADGKPKRKVFTAGTRHEVADEMTKALRDRQRGINIDPEKQTVGDFLSRWIDTVKRDVAPATYVSYEATVRLHLTPALGNIPLAKLGAHHIEKLKQDCVCQLDLAHFDALIWPPASLPLLRSIPVIS